MTRRRLLDPRRPAPGTTDGEFDLRAELFLPPANDERGGAVPLGRPPAPCVRPPLVLQVTLRTSQPAGCRRNRLVSVTARGCSSGLRRRSRRRRGRVPAVVRLDLVACARQIARGVVSGSRGRGEVPGAVGEQATHRRGVQLARSGRGARHPAALRRGRPRLRERPDRCERRLVRSAASRNHLPVASARAAAPPDPEPGRPTASPHFAGGTVAAVTSSRSPSPSIGDIGGGTTSGRVGGQRRRRRASPGVRRNCACTPSGQVGRALRMSGGTVWYRLTGPATRRVLLRLSASEELDAVVAVFRPVRSRLDLVACAPTDRKGSLVLGFAARPRARYLVAVGEQRNSPPGAFSLQLQPAEAPERHPGRALRRGGVRDSVNGLTDVNDVSVRSCVGDDLPARLQLEPVCPRPLLYARNRVVRLSCRAHSTFTPGRDGGGRYVVEVTASPTATRQRYRLHIAAAAADDVGVGVELRPGSGARGSLSPSGVDVLDLYHFDVVRHSEVRLRLSQTAGSFGLVVLTDTGSRMAAGGGEFRRRLGRVAALRRRRARSGGTAPGAIALPLAAGCWSPPPAQLGGDQPRLFRVAQSASSRPQRAAGSSSRSIGSTR